MASLNVYAVFGVLVIMASGAAMAREMVDENELSKLCEPKMTLHCADQVFGSIFETGTVNDNCCVELMRLGKQCHFALVKRNFQNPLFGDYDPRKILFKSVATWDRCALLNQDVSPSPSPC